MSFWHPGEGVYLENGPLSFLIFNVDNTTTLISRVFLLIRSFKPLGIFSYSRLPTFYSENFQRLQQS